MNNDLIIALLILAGFYLFVGWLVDNCIRDTRQRIDEFDKPSLFIWIFWPLMLAWYFIYYLIASFVREIKYWLWKWEYR